MKKLIVVIVILATATVFANDKKSNETGNQKLREEISVLLEKPQIEIEKDSVEASIKFILNAKNEIVILTVDSEKEAIENYVKLRLNYQKVNFDSSRGKNKIFKMNLKILNPNLG